MRSSLAAVARTLRRHAQPVVDITLALQAAALAGYAGFYFGTALGLIIFAITPARGHDAAQWIADDALRNTAGEWCCGKNDCEPISPASKDNPAGFVIVPGGYWLNGTKESIPFNEVAPLSIDGRLWICRRPDGSIRCAFDRRPGS